MWEHPVRLCGREVRAILSGSKTQLRRVVKHHGDFLGSGGKSNLDEWDDPNFWGWEDPSNPSHFIVLGRNPKDRHDSPVRCPYGQPGDRLWVRETWCRAMGARDHTDRDPDLVWYRADGQARYCVGSDDRLDPTADPWDAPDGEADAWVKTEGGWKPSIHMPRWASRMTLEITDVRVERLQEISEADAIAEGIASSPCVARPGRLVWCDYNIPNDPFEWYADPVLSYRSLWESINTKPSFCWDADPWVWRISFRRVEEVAR